MNNFVCDQFQESVNDLLVKHKSILDVLSKQQESSARVNRAIVKAVTSCGCIEINAKKQEYGKDEAMEQIHKILNNHLNGNLCDKCRDVIEEELGNHFFYLAAICNSLDLNMSDIFTKEQRKINTLGIYNMLR